MQFDNVYDYIAKEETDFKTRSVPITDGWEWNMFDHIRRSTLYKNSKFDKGADDGSRPFKNIIRPILNVAYRSEGFDVKDIVPYVDDEKNYYKSFIIKKYHPRWARKNDLDTFIDELVESYCDYGLGLAKNVYNIRPEVVKLQALAFCDQTDILAGPICLRHEYTMDQLSDMSGKWDEGMISLALAQARDQKSTSSQNKEEAKTPGKYIEVYELHGTLPKEWLYDEGAYDDEGEYIGETYDDEKPFVPQMQIVTYYKDTDGKKKGICLFKGIERKPIFKAIVRDSIFGRACGFGGIEELFEPQVWTNYSEIKIKAMLDAASLLILQTSDAAFATKNRTTDLETGEILVHEDGKPVTQVSIQAQNLEAFNDAVARWEQQGRTTGSADEAQLGKSPADGTPFRLQALVTQAGQGLHDYRRGKMATFVAQIYRDWILEFLVDDINQGKKFLEELSIDELQGISDAVITNMANGAILDYFLKGRVLTQDEVDKFKADAKTQFMKLGTKRFLEFLKDELKSTPMDVEVNIAGKQKDLAAAADKLTNIFRQIIAAPQILQQPGMGKLFNEIIEASGFSPIDFSSFTNQPAPNPAQQTPVNPVAQPNAQIPSNFIPNQNQQVNK